MSRASDRPAVVVLAVAWGLGAVGLFSLDQPADPAATAALVAYVDTAPDPTAVEIDAAEALARLRPWHPGYPDARTELSHIESRRRQRLDD